MSGNRLTSSVSPGLSLLAVVFTEGREEGEYQVGTGGWAWGWVGSFSSPFSGTVILWET